MHQHLLHYLDSQRTAFSVPSKTAELNHKDLNYILAVLVKTLWASLLFFSLKPIIGLNRTMTQRVAIKRKEIQ